MPLYETIEDRLQEQSVSDKLKEAWKVDVWSFAPYTTTGDLLLGRNGVLRAICEVKRRYNARDKYETYIISRSKLERISAMSKSLNTKGYWLYSSMTYLSGTMQHQHWCTRLGGVEDMIGKTRMIWS